MCALQYATVDFEIFRCFLWHRRLCDYEHTRPILNREHVQTLHKQAGYFTPLTMDPYESGAFAIDESLKYRVRDHANSKSALKDRTLRKRHRVKFKSAAAVNQEIRL